MLWIQNHVTLWCVIQILSFLKWLWMENPSIVLNNIHKAHVWHGIMNACSGHGLSVSYETAVTGQTITSATVVEYTSLLNHRITFSSGAFSALVGNSNTISTISSFSFAHADFFVPTHDFSLSLFLKTHLVVGYSAVLTGITLGEIPMPDGILRLPFHAKVKTYI